MYIVNIVNMWYNIKMSTDYELSPESRELADRIAESFDAVLAGAPIQTGSYSRGEYLYIPFEDDGLVDPHHHPNPRMRNYSVIEADYCEQDVFTYRITDFYPKGHPSSKTAWPYSHYSEYVYLPSRSQMLAHNYDTNRIMPLDTDQLLPIFGRFEQYEFVHRPTLKQALLEQALASKAGNIALRYFPKFGI